MTVKDLAEETSKKGNGNKENNSKVKTVLKFIILTAIIIIVIVVGSKIEVEQLGEHIQQYF